jgi:hypothetical protein
MKKIIMTLSLQAICLGALIAQKPAVVVNDKAGWHKIGETTVDFQKDHDEVAVLLADRFATLKFRVTESPIELLDIDVIFKEGDKQNIRIGYAIKTAGSESREIDLKGGAERDIKSIAFRYKTVENRADKKARVEIWGKKTNAGKGAGNSELKKDAKEAKSDMKEAGHDAKHEMKEESREVKKDAKRAGEKADRKMEKETKEAKKEARETKNEAKEELRKD